jgi:glycosyltransferase involved in cell wall biosynthesis
MMKKYESSLLMVSVSNVPIDGRVVRSAIALASRFSRVKVVGFTRGERNPPEIHNLDFSLFLLKDPPGTGPMASTLRRFSRLWILIRMAWTVLFSKADVYYSHEAHLLPIAWLAARIRGAKVVYDIHEIYGEMGTGLASHVLKRLEAPLIHSCDVLITTNSDRATRISRKNLIALSQINVIRNLPIVNPSPHSALDVFKDSHSIKCVYHGRLSLADRALDVLVRVIGSMPGFELAIIGIDSLGVRSKLESIAGESPLSNVYFLEPVPPDQLVSFTTGADIGILPYRNIGLNTSLASPNKLWEYIASGLFVLSSPFPEALRLFDVCPCGISADISSEIELRKQLETIQSMSDLESKKFTAKQYYNEHLSWEIEAEKIRNIVSNPMLSEFQT